MTGRHKDICGVLSEWCEVDKDGAAPDSCTADLVAFLQRCMRDSPKAKRERQRQFSHDVGPGRRPRCQAARAETRENAGRRMNENRLCRLTFSNKSCIRF